MNQENVEEPLDRNKLKIQALVEKNAQLQNENADLRVELTIYDNEFQKLARRLQELEADAVSEEDATEPSEPTDPVS